MLTIRLKRTGRKNQPSFRVIVTPKGLGGPKGKPVEYLGWYNSLLKKFELEKERIQYWLSQGAQPSASLHNLLIKAGISSGSKVPVHKKSKKPASPDASQGGPAEAQPQTAPEAKSEAETAQPQAEQQPSTETEAQPAADSASEAAAASEEKPAK